MSADKHKQSVYFDGPMLREIREEALRTGLSVSEIVQRAWVHARPRIAAIPVDTIEAQVDHSPS